MKDIILTGDRPTGRLHIGHYVGSLRERVRLQNTASYAAFYVMIADAQALTDNASDPGKIRTSVLEVMLDYLAVGLDPAKVTFFVQSGVPALPEITAYYMNLVTLSRVTRNPTVKTELRSKHFGNSVPIGFVNYPVSQAADITAFKATLVPVGADQEPMLEQTREIVRTFNRTYQTDALVECQGIFADSQVCTRLPGLDGNEKMSKSLGNSIYLADDEPTLRQKVNAIKTFPRELSAPGILEGNVMFAYLEAFCQADSFEKFYPEFANLDTLKAAYAQGGIGDRRVKDFLYEVLNAELAPIRQRRAQFAERLPEIKQILAEGTQQAAAVAAQTLLEMKRAMGIDYFGPEGL